MTVKEQRAHDFALEIMRMYFEISKNNKDSDVVSKESIDTRAMFDIYNCAYKYAMENED